MHVTDERPLDPQSRYSRKSLTAWPHEISLGLPLANFPSISQDIHGKFALRVPVIPLLSEPCAALILGKAITGIPAFS